MITSIFINALGQAIFESCGQALLIYVVLQLAMQLFPAINSKYRYDMNYLGLTIITCWFLANLINIYMHDAAMAKYTVLNSGIGIIYGIKHMPSLLQQAEAFISKYAYYITGLYLIGLVLHSFKLLGGFVHIHQIRKQKNLTEDSIWTAKAKQLCEKLKVIKAVSLYFSEHIQVPLTIGYFKPIIIFPIALINNLDTEQVEAILMHELAHIKRHDYLVNILQCVMETILCFNPFVWLISKTIRQEREYCCDDMVMDEEYNNFTYSKALYIIAQQSNQNYALAMAAAHKKYPLLNRIKRLNNMKTNDTLPKFHLLVIVTVAAICGLLAWGIPQYSAAKTPAIKKTAKHYAATVNHIATPVVAPIAPVPAVSLAGTKVVVNAYHDTASNKNIADTNHTGTFKIVIEENGIKREYNSVEQLPDSEKAEFIKQNPAFGSFNTFKFDLKDSIKFASMEKFKMTPGFKKQMKDMHMQSLKMQKQFNSDAWKKQMLDSKKLSEEMTKQFNSPEWKKQMEDMQKQAENLQTKMNSPEFKKQMEDSKMLSEKISKEVNSAVWKAQMAEIHQQTDMKLQAERINKQVNSAVWKAQMKDMQKQADKMSKQLNSPELKKQMEEVQQKVKLEVDEQMKESAADSAKAVTDKKPK